MLLGRFKNYISDQELCTASDKVLLAVSGGVDSMVMLNLFSKTDIPIAVAHCNFSLRGSESDADEILVRKVSEEMDIEFFSITFDTMSVIEESGNSLQVVARDLRYEWFNKLCNTFGFTKIAIAHNADDTVETFFINLIRGTGIKGLTGIPVCNDLKIRPLLFAKRSEIEAYAKRNRVEYRNDSSNAQTKYLRNKIRHKIVPQLNTISDNFIDTMTDNIGHLNRAVDFIDNFISQIATEAVVTNKDERAIHLDLLTKYPSLEYVLYELIKDASFKGAVIDDMVECYRRGASGRSFTSPSHKALLDRGRLIITKNIDHKQLSTDSITIESGDVISMLDDLVIKSEIVDIESINSLITPKNIAIFDAETVTFPLTLRYWRAGDSFTPLGMRGSKKISDYLVDIKMPLDKKEHQTVIESNGKIIWLTSQRISTHTKVTLSTEKVVRLTAISQSDANVNLLE